MFDGRLHERVVVRMELDQIDPVTEAVVRAQARTVTVRVERQCVQRAARQGAISGDVVHERLPALASQGFAQHDVVRPEIARGELRWLVGDDVRFERRQVGHGGAREPGQPH